MNEPPNTPKLPLGKVASGLAVLAGLLLALSAFLPWVGGAGAAELTTGIAIDESGNGFIGSRAGWSGGDGIVFVIAGLVSLGVGALGLIGSPKHWHRPALILTAVVAGTWVFMDTSEIGSVTAFDGSTLDLGLSVGPFVAGLGAAAALAAAVLVQSDRRSRAVDAEELAWRLDGRGLKRDSLEIRQRVFKRSARNVGRGGLEEEDLARMVNAMGYDQAVLGFDNAAAPNNHLLAREIERIFADDAESLAHQRAGVAENFVYCDFAYSVTYLDWLWQEAVRTFVDDPGTLAGVESDCLVVRNKINRIASQATHH